MAAPTLKETSPNYICDNMIEKVPEDGILVRLKSHFFGSIIALLIGVFTAFFIIVISLYLLT